VVSRNGELAVALRDSVDVSMAMVRDVRPDEVQNAIAACRPWPWMLVGDVTSLPPPVLELLQRRPVLVLWHGPLPAGVVRATAFERFSELRAAVGASLAATRDGMRLAPGVGVAMPDGSVRSSASLQAYVSTLDRA